MATNQHSQDIRITKYGLPEATETQSGYMVKLSGEILSDRDSRPHGYLDVITFDIPTEVKIMQMDLTVGSVVNVTGDLSVRRWKGNQGFVYKTQLEVDTITLVSRVDTRQMTDAEMEEAAALLGVNRKPETVEQQLAALLGGKPETVGHKLAALLGVVGNGQMHANRTTGEVSGDAVVIEEATEPPTGNKRKERAA